ncbi:MAG: hypothetical protein AAGI49_05140 [Bacteroidota bacterium]
MDIISPTYANFLTDSEVYDALEAMWATWFEEIAEEHDLQLQPFFTKTNAEDEKIRDANPIFSGLKPNKNRLLRILQVPAEEVEGNYIQGWTDTFGEEDEEEGIEQLVIDLVLSDENKAIARTWVIKWLVEELERSEMEEVLDVESVLEEETVIE